MNLFSGENGVKITIGFNIFLNSDKFPIKDEEAHGFLNIALTYPSKGPGIEPLVRKERFLFTVETTIPEEHFQFFDESKLAKLVAIKVAQVVNLTYFGAFTAKVENVAFIDGTVGDFIVYETT